MSEIAERLRIAEQDIQQLKEAVFGSRKSETKTESSKDFDLVDIKETTSTSESTDDSHLSGGKPEQEEPNIGMPEQEEPVKNEEAAS